MTLAGFSRALKTAATGVRGAPVIAQPLPSPMGSAYRRQYRSVYGLLPRPTVFESERSVSLEFFPSSQKCCDGYSDTERFRLCYFGVVPLEVFGLPGFLFFRILPVFSFGDFKEQSEEGRMRGEGSDCIGKVIHALVLHKKTA